jgi:hypothetical protein
LIVQPTPRFVFELVARDRPIISHVKRGRACVKLTAPRSPHSAFSLTQHPACQCSRPDMVVQNRPAKIRPVRTLIGIVIFFPRKLRRNAHLTWRGANLSHGGRGESTRASPVFAFARVHAANNLVGFLPSSPVALIRRLIHPWTVSSATCQTSTFRRTFKTVSYRQLAGSGTFV